MGKFHIFLRETKLKGVSRAWTMIKRKSISLCKVKDIISTKLSNHRQSQPGCKHTCTSIAYWFDVSRSKYQRSTDTTKYQPKPYFCIISVLRSWLLCFCSFLLFLWKHLASWCHHSLRSQGLSACTRLNYSKMAEVCWPYTLKWLLKTSFM